MATIGIWGGTGYAGSAIAREARKRGFEVTAVSRHAPQDQIEDVTYVQGSVADANFVEQVAAHDVVVVALHAIGEPSLAEVYDSLVKTARASGARLA
ncbi:MAG TPA: NAD(P)H-binding protein, partial [Marmoricola sp.]|nr:NAD(P)H-binding protein [Marmoricola sp.]